MRTNIYMKSLLPLVGLFCYLASGALYATCPPSPGTHYNSLRTLATFSRNMNAETRYDRETNFDGGVYREVELDVLPFSIAYQNKTHTLKSTDYCVYLPRSIPNLHRVQVTSGNWNVHYHEADRLIEFTSQDPAGAEPLLAAKVWWGKYPMPIPQPFRDAVTLIKVTGDDCLPLGSFCFDRQH